MLAEALLWLVLQAVVAAVPTANDQFPDLLPRSCGRRQVQLGDTTQPFIVGEGNTTAYYGEYPWQARLLTFNPKARGYSHQCGAIIVTRRHVLTAAHCVQHIATSQMLVRVGELRFGRSDAEFAAKEFGVASSRMHHRFTGSHGLVNDIALLRLRIRPGESLQFSAYVTPACLPAAGLSYETNLGCEVSGWGRTSDHSPISAQLRGVEVPIVSDTFCGSPEIYEDRFVAGRMFCAGLTLGGPDSCRGDSGGPLACLDEEGEEFIAYGIVSSGDPLGCGRRPGLYTRVSFYIDWLRRRLEVDREDELAEMIQTRSDQACGHVTFIPPTALDAAFVESPAHFPWLVTVRSAMTQCGGVILSNRWVLTASLCLRNETTKVRMGEITSGSGLSGIEIEIDRKLIRPSSSGQVGKPAFALLRTKSDIVFTKHVSPVCLPDDSSLSPVRTGLDLIFVGWGNPTATLVSQQQRLKWSRSRAVNIDECKTNYTQFLHTVSEFLTDEAFCTKFLRPNDEFDCALGGGDSGGMFMDRVINDGRESWRVLGTNVAGVGCGTEQFPDINAALGPSIPWIRSVMDDADA